MAGSEHLVPSWRGVSQRIQFPVSSDDAWGITPDSLNNLRTTLSFASTFNNMPVLQITETFTRPGPVGQQTVQQVNSVALDIDGTNALLCTASRLL